MKYFKYILTLVVLVSIVSLSCERDDICAETTQTTPHLIIRFYDINETEELKDVRLLTVSGIDENDNLLSEIVSNSTTDSIVVPLNFQEENTPTISRFALKKDTDLDSDANDPDNTLTMSNTDIIEVTYTPQFIYVSRACGYKSVFELAGITREVDDNLWIINQTIINSTVENENAAHINIYH